jgi:hypothetical protein
MLLDYVHTGRPNRPSGTSRPATGSSPGVKPDNPYTPRPSARDSPPRASPNHDQGIQITRSTEPASMSAPRFTPD